MIRNRDFYSEFQFHASRSGGAGGQHVNKVASKVELRFHVMNSALLSDEEKALVSQKLAKQINQEGFLQVVCQEERSQLRNKDRCVKKFYLLLQKALQKQKNRKATKPTAASVKERLFEKKKRAARKSDRSYRPSDDS